MASFVVERIYNWGTRCKPSPIVSVLYRNTFCNHLRFNTHQHFITSKKFNMKKIFYFLMALMVSQNVFGQTCTPLVSSPGNVNITWTGVVSTDWNTACNCFLLMFGEGQQPKANCLFTIKNIHFGPKKQGFPLV